jgi:hypothetical protein
MQKVRRKNLFRFHRLLFLIPFQFLFHFPSSGTSFTFPSRYLFTIDHGNIFSLRGWTPYLQTGFHVSHFTLFETNQYDTGLLPSLVDFPKSFYFWNLFLLALPISLATTLGISVDFFSFRSLDVSLCEVFCLNLQVVFPRKKAVLRILVSPSLISSLLYVLFSMPRHPRNVLLRSSFHYRNVCDVSSHFLPRGKGSFLF